jgi:hypothetical protein
MPGAPGRQTNQHHPAEGPIISVLVADDQANLAHLDLARPYQQGGGGKVQAEGSFGGHARGDDWRVPCAEQGLRARKRSLSG